jgi:DNA repair protein RecO (recombination protein O)
MSTSQASLAIILRTRSYGESDKIVTLLTEDAGKITGIAKGAKNSRRRFANCLDPFTRVRVHYRARPGASLVFLESCDLIEPSGSLAQPNKFAYGSYLVELVDLLTAEGQPVRELYHLLADGLEALRNGPATGSFLRVFELQLLRHSGYGPELQQCGRCGRKLGSAEAVFFDPPRGSIVCDACGSGAEAAVPVTGQTLAALEAIKQAPLAAVRGHRLAPPLAAEAATLMGHLLAVHLPRPPRSVKLIAALERS